MSCGSSRFSGAGGMTCTPNRSTLGFGGSGGGGGGQDSPAGCPALSLLHAACPSALPSAAALLLPMLLLLPSFAPSPKGTGVSVSAAPAGRLNSWERALQGVLHVPGVLRPALIKTDTGDCCGPPKPSLRALRVPPSASSAESSWPNWCCDAHLLFPLAAPLPLAPPSMSAAASRGVLRSEEAALSASPPVKPPPPAAELSRRKRARRSARRASSCCFRRWPIENAASSSLAGAGGRERSVCSSAAPEKSTSRRRVSRLCTAAVWGGMLGSPPPRRCAGPRRPRSPMRCQQL